MTSIMFLQFYSGFLCALVLVVSASDQTVKISVRTLKSDLDAFLEDPNRAPYMNIEYAEGAVLSMSLQSKPDGKGEFLTFDGIVNIKLPDGSILQENNLIYKDGSFGLQSTYDDITYVIIKPDTKKLIKPAMYVIQYISMKRLTQDLRNEFQEAKNQKYYHSTQCTWRGYRIGSSSTSMLLRRRDERFLIEKPLKGISIHDEEDDDGCLRFLKKNVHNDQSPDQCNKQFDIFFNVWFDPKSKIYGSSTGFMGWVDAVRVV